MQIGTDKTFKRIIDKAIEISNETVGQPCNRAQELASVFLLKNILNCLTIWYILHPKYITNFKNLPPNSQIHDFTSANVILRSLFEGYVNMYWLLIDSKDPKSEEIRDFRLDLWERHALIETKEMVKLIGSQYPQQLEQEKQKYLHRIQNSDYFKNLPSDEQKSYLKFDKWTTMRVLTRADKTGMHRSQSEFLYKFLSNYTHSTSYCLKQVSSVHSPIDANTILEISRRFSEMLLALTLQAFRQIHPQIENFFDEETKNIISKWEVLKGKDLKELI